MENSNNLIEDSLKLPPIGQTKNFIWIATTIGIAALCKTEENCKNPPFEKAVKEAIEVAIDLSREERESHQTEQGLVLIFYS